MALAMDIVFAGLKLRKKKNSKDAHTKNEKELEKNELCAGIKWVILE